MMMMMILQQHTNNNKTNRRIPDRKPERGGGKGGTTEVDEWATDRPACLMPACSFFPPALQSRFFFHRLSLLPDCLHHTMPPSPLPPLAAPPEPHTPARLASPPPPPSMLLAPIPPTSSVSRTPWLLLPASPGLLLTYSSCSAPCCLVRVRRPLAQS